ncbi:AraC family transcriptional regulator [Listeria ilorinensis]|uniref:AraC family transcriptional regulator n=1 Tax=Listeria ilorinensis TaxID=2867439 RepID=UPI001EF63EA1|nr:helix-turn-helix domain-containing protein [Listeria ilorinensis]
MNPEILELLHTYSQPRNWQTISQSFHVKVAGYVGKEPVYEFFDTLTDNLALNNQSISVSVQPVSSHIPYHIHDYVEIIIPLLGHCTVVTKKETLTVKQDELLVIGNRTIHTVEPISPSTIVVNIALKNTAFSLNDLNFMLRGGNSQSIATFLFSLLSNEAELEGRYSLFKTNHDPKIVSTVYDIIKEYYFPDIQTNHIIRFEILTLFSRLVRIAYHTQLEIVDTEQSKTDLLMLLLYIEKNYAEITLEEMAHYFGFNPNYLSSYLKRQTGRTFIKLVHLQRINAAAEFLVNTNVPIEQIALKVGYENPSYFYKVFRRNLGLSPAEYREQYR